MEKKVNWKRSRAHIRNASKKAIFADSVAGVLFLSEQLQQFNWVLRIICVAKYQSICIYAAPDKFYFNCTHS